MIELKMTGMCEGCPHGEITVERAWAHEPRGVTIGFYAVRCEHEEACRRAKGGEEYEWRKA